MPTNALLYIMKSLLIGILCGMIFALFKLPIPAPVVFEGVLGIFGLFLGYKLITLIW